MAPSQSDRLASPRGWWSSRWRSLGLAYGQRSHLSAELSRTQQRLEKLRHRVDDDRSPPAIAILVTTIGIILSLLVRIAALLRPDTLLRISFSAFTGRHRPRCARTRSGPRPVPSGRYRSLRRDPADHLDRHVPRPCRSGCSSAIYLSEYADPAGACARSSPIARGPGRHSRRSSTDSFAALTVAPLDPRLGRGHRSGGVASESALAAGLVMGMMIIPFVSSLTDDVMNAVPQSSAGRRLRAWARPTRKPSSR